MMIAVTMLIYTLSLKFRLPSSIIIYNLCLNTRLISPVYFGNGAVCPKLSSQQIDIGAVMAANFDIYPTQSEFEGALLYKLQINLHNGHDMNALTTETNRNEEAHVYMLQPGK
jgi:hypothetical protein